MNYLKLAGGFVKDNAPAILTGACIASTVAAVVTAAKVAPKALYIRDETPDDAEYIKKTWTLWAPVVGLTAASISFAVAARATEARKTAALAGAYWVAEQQYKELKNRVNTNAPVISQEREEATSAAIKSAGPVSNQEIIFVSDDSKHLCFDTLTGRYFFSTIETLRKAQNTLNARVISEMYASQNDFYSLIELPHVSLGNDLGWNTDRLMDLEFRPFITEDGKPCIAIGYEFDPMREYDNLH